jgi:hypothetical protein
VSTVYTSIQCNKNVLDTEVAYAKSFLFYSRPFLFFVDVHVVPSHAVSVSLSFVNLCSGRVYYSSVFLFSLSRFLLFLPPLDAVFLTEDELL